MKIILRGSIAHSLAKAAPALRYTQQASLSLLVAAAVVMCVLGYLQIILGD